MLSCLVNKSGSVCGIDGTHNHRELLSMYGVVVKEEYLAYSFSLVYRSLLRIGDPLTGRTPSWANATHDEAALKFFNDRVGTSERLISFVMDGHADDSDLVIMLHPRKRELFIGGGLEMKKHITRLCASLGSCFRGGDCRFTCSDDVCPNAGHSFGPNYPKINLTIWCNLFRDKANRAKAWRD